HGDGCPGGLARRRGKRRKRRRDHDVGVGYRGYQGQKLIQELLGFPDGLEHLPIPCHYWTAHICCKKLSPLVMWQPKLSATVWPTSASELRVPRETPLPFPFFSNAISGQYSRE